MPSCVPSVGVACVKWPLSRGCVDVPAHDCRAFINVVVPVFASTVTVPSVNEGEFDEPVDVSEVEEVDFEPATDGQERVAREFICALAKRRSKTVLGRAGTGKSHLIRHLYATVLYNGFGMIVGAHTACVAQRLQRDGVDCGTLYSQFRYRCGDRSLRIPDNVSVVVVDEVGTVPSNFIKCLKRAIALRSCLLLWRCVAVAARRGVAIQRGEGV